ncbi:MAG: iron chaperone [Carbonactinosporaceae bacterium]
MADNFASIDDYISSFPEDVQIVLEEVRRTIRNVVPTADEAISYQIPAIKLNDRYLVYFAAWKHHIALYPIPTADEAFEQEIAPYKAGKGTLRFPFRKPIPHDLIERVVALLVKQRVDSGG